MWNRVPIENVHTFDDALLSILREARPFPAKPSAQFLSSVALGSHGISLPPGSRIGVSAYKSSPCTRFLAIRLESVPCRQFSEAVLIAFTSLRSWLRYN